MKSLKLLLAIGFALTILIPALPSTAAPSQPGLAEDYNITPNATNKWPSIAVANDMLRVAWSNKNEANYAERTEESGAFSSAKVGVTGNNSTYFNAAVAVGQDGSIHYAWISNEGGTIYHISKSGTAWSAVHTVAAGQNFANTLNIAARGSNEVFITWRHQGSSSNGYVAFAYSNNSGASWPVIADASAPQGAYAGRPDIVAGPANLPVFLTWTGVDGSVYLAEWTGSNFSTSCLTCARYGPRKDFFNPSVAMSNDGRPYVAWRSVNDGVYYASRQPNGTWGYSNAFRYPEVSSVSIAVDKRNNVHLAWLSKANNRTDGYYVVSAPQPGGGESFSSPIIFTLDNGAFKADLDMTASAKSTYGLAHIAYESFGGGQFIRYARIRTEGIGCSSSAASRSEADGIVKIRAIYSKPVYMPMIVNGSVPPTPTPTPTPLPPTPTPTPPPSC
jgi:hypothetical protein